MTPKSFSIKIFSTLFCLGLLASCSNGVIRPKSSLSTSGGTASQLNVNATLISAEEASNQLSVTLRFDSSITKTLQPIPQYCTVTGSGETNPRPCTCQIERRVISPNGGNPYLFDKVDTTTLTSVGSYELACGLPTDYAQIPTGTVVKFSVLPAQGNSSGLSTNVFERVKGATSSGGTADYTTSAGIRFNDILNFVCFERQTVLPSLLNKVDTFSGDPGGGTRNNIPLATQFCSKTNDSSGIGTCPSPSGAQNSAQSGYFHFLVRNKAGGALGITNNNSRYYCPQVDEGLPKRGDFANGPNFYPLRSDFSLAQTWSTQFPIGIEAPSALYDGSQATAPTRCKGPDGSDPEALPTPDPGQISTQCKGYAAPVQSNGRCGYFMDQNNSVRLMTHLRQYVRLGPLHMDADGRFAKSGARAVEVLYVPDRVVENPNADPLNPFTMLGPLPCEEAVLDHKGVTKKRPVALVDAGSNLRSGPNFPRGMGVPVYMSRAGSFVAINKYTAANPTNTQYNTGFEGKNMDGIFFPNHDSKADLSCSAILPRVAYNSYLAPSGMALFTTNHSARNPIAVQPGDNSTSPAYPIYTDEVYLRPIEKGERTKWVLNPDFQACAPAPKDGVHDAFLHFVKKPNGATAYCVSDYPTRMTDLDRFDRYLDGTLSGRFKNFTSPVVKNVRNPTSTCNATPISNLGSIAGTYPAAGQDANDYIGWAHHDQSSKVDHDGANFIGADKTCDQTLTQSTNSDLKAIPLQAEPHDIEEALWNDEQYECKITYDAAGGKSWKQYQGGQTPSSGCCGVDESGALILKDQFQSGVGTGVPNAADIANRKNSTSYRSVERYTAGARPDPVTGKICGKITY